MDLVCLFFCILLFLMRSFTLNLVGPTKIPIQVVMCLQHFWYKRLMTGFPFSLRKRDQTLQSKEIRQKWCRRNSNTRKNLASIFGSWLIKSLAVVTRIPGLFALIPLDARTTIPPILHVQRFNAAQITMGLGFRERIKRVYLLILLFLYSYALKQYLASPDRDLVNFRWTLFYIIFKCFLIFISPQFNFADAQLVTNIQFNKQTKIIWVSV